MTTEKKVISCADAGAGCSWSVSDVDEDEVIASTLEHAQRKHSMELTADQVRPMLKQVACNC